MSDQTSHPTEPTTPPADGVGPASGGGANPPPPTGATAVAEPPPASAKKSRTGLIVGIVAALVILALVAVLLVVFVFAKGDDKHSITIPSTAGGMKQDKAKEAQLKQQLTAAEEQFKTQSKNVSYVKSGVYNQDDSGRGPKGAIVFLGGKVKASEKNPQRFVTKFTKQATSNGFKIDKISAGDAGGKALCAYQSKGQKIAVCAWATNDSMGEVVPTVVPGYDSKQLSKLMLDLRSDVEKTE
jgi:hypothetical protein